MSNLEMVVCLSCCQARDNEKPGTVVFQGTGEECQAYIDSRINRVDIQSHPSDACVARAKCAAKAFYESSGDVFFRGIPIDEFDREEVVGICAMLAKQLSEHDRREINRLSLALGSMRKEEA